MTSDCHSEFGTPLSQEDAERYFELRSMLYEFTKLFDYEDPSARAVAIVGAAFLDTLLSEALTNFLVNDKKEVSKLLRPDGPLGTFGSRITACYCLGLIGDIVKNDLRLVGKIRNRFAHDIRADFADDQIKNWCKSLSWHKEFCAEPPAGATDRDLFQVGVNQLVSHLNGIVDIARIQQRSKRTYT